MLKRRDINNQVAFWKQADNGLELEPFTLEPPLPLTGRSTALVPSSLLSHGLYLLDDIWVVTTANLPQPSHDELQ